MLKRFISLVIAVIIAGGFAYGFSYGANKFLPTAMNTDKIDTERPENIKPSFSGSQVLNFTIPGDDDIEGHKQLAYQLYTIACQKYNEAPQSATFVSYNTSTMNIPANGFRHTVRNNGEFYYTEYCFVDKENQLFLGLFARESTMFAERRYTNSSMNNVQAEKVINPIPTFTMDENNKITYIVDWKKCRQLEYEKPDFSFLTDQNVQVETMLNAKVSYDAEKEYYTLRFELDVNNPLTTEKTLPVLRAGFGNDTAHYTSMVEEFHIWNNGYPRYFRSLDGWEGKNFIDVVAVLDFETYYYYDDKSCDYKSYQFMEEFKNKLS